MKSRAISLTVSLSWRVVEEICIQKSQDAGAVVGKGNKWKWLK